jgi:hypothetical protein
MIVAAVLERLGKDTPSRKKVKADSSAGRK